MNISTDIIQPCWNIIGGAAITYAFVQYHFSNSKAKLQNKLNIEREKTIQTMQSDLDAMLEEKKTHLDNTKYVFQVQFEYTYRQLVALSQDKEKIYKSMLELGLFQKGQLTDISHLVMQLGEKLTSIRPFLEESIYQAFLPYIASVENYSQCLKYFQAPDSESDAILNSKHELYSSILKKIVGESTLRETLKSQMRKMGNYHQSRENHTTASYLESIDAMNDFDVYKAVMLNHYTREAISARKALNNQIREYIMSRQVIPAVTTAKL